MHPPRIPPDNWVIFLQRRLSEKAMEISEKNAANRQKQVIPHTLGSKTLARKKNEVEKKDRRRYSKAEMYPIAHKRKVGSYVNEEAKRKAEQLENEINDGSFDNEAFIKVFGKEHPGHRRGVGFRPIYRSNGSSSGNGRIEKLQSEVDELKTKLAGVDELKAQFAFFMQNYKGNQVADIQSPKEVRRSSASSHDPQDHGVSSSHGRN